MPRLAMNSVYDYADDLVIFWWIEIENASFLKPVNMAGIPANMTA
jgi:hypothetical protein